MSTLDLIFEKAKTLPGPMQHEALGFLEYLGRRQDAQAHADAWQQLARETRSATGGREITEAEIAAEIAADRAGR